MLMLHFEFAYTTILFSILDNSLQHRYVVVSASLCRGYRPKTEFVQIVALFDSFQPQVHTTVVRS